MYYFVSVDLVALVDVVSLGVIVRQLVKDKNQIVIIVLGNMKCLNALRVV